MTTSATTAIDAIGAKFVETLREWLSPKAFEIMQIRNTYEDDKGICHSHDFCDANMAMAEAFEMIVEREPDVADEQDVIIWNAAWEHARSKGLLLDDAGRAAIGARAARNNARTYAITKRIASGELSAEEGVAALLRKNGVDP